MRLTFTLLISFFISAALIAQPANDICEDAIQINIGDCGIYDNVAANTDVGNVNFNPIGLTCPMAENEVWFYFIPSNPPTSLQLSVTGVADGGNPAMVQPRITLIRGECLEFEAADCVEAAAGSDFASMNIDETTLIPGIPYYILVSDWSATAASNEGSFELCLEEYEPPSVIDNITVTDCDGTIFDTGGETGDYGPNENFVFTITPAAFNQCIVANVNFYDIENFSDQLNFYNGTGTNAPLLGSISGVGANFEVQASSGSLTIEFLSDGSVQNGGFEISWQCTPDECTVLSPIDVDPNVTVDDLVDALSSPQVIVENPILNCPDGAYGVFNSPGNTQLENMGIPNGIILSSGLAEDAENPEFFFASTGFNAPGDADLDALSNVASNDACVLEFDVYAATDELLFNYVFGSEEYPNFVGTDFNDIFAFFISGPGLAPNTNIAVLSNGTPVEINTVNDQAPFDPVTGDVIYNDNAGGASLPYGGYTSVLTARADVIPCNYYHLKLAIADRSDDIYDSSVFIADLQAGLPELELVFQINSSSGDNILVEGCSNGDYINAILDNPDTEDITYYITVNGDIDENADLVTPLPDSLIAVAGQTTEIQIPIEPVMDGIPEGVESFGIQVFSVFECDTVVYDSVSVLIYDDIDIEPSQDTFFVCSGTDVQLEVSGATDYTWTWPIPGELDNPNLPNPVLSPSQSGYIYVDGIISANTNCVDTDSAYIQIIDPTITTSTPAPVICEGESAALMVTTNTNNTGISWDPVGGLSCTDCPNPTASPDVTTTYTATVSAGGCSSSIDVIVTVDPLAIPPIIPDTEICEGESITLAGPPTGLGVGTTTYMWTPNDGSLDDPTSPTPTATPSQQTTYTVVSTSGNGVCVNTQSVTIDVFPASIDILGLETITQCNDALAPVTFTTTSIVDPSLIQWTDSNGNDLGNGGSITVNPSSSTTYTATIQSGACINSDQATIQIDSLPDFDLDVIVPTQGISVTNPDTVDICSDPDELFFVSNVYNAALYPELTHEWLANGIPLTPPQEGANLVDTLPLSTTTYYLVSQNGACSSIDSFVMDVNTPPDFSITPTSANICAGESVQLEAMGSANFTWTPDDGSLSATDIANPIATPTQTTEYTAFAELNGCQVGISTIITVSETPSLNLGGDQIICGGTQTTIGDPNYDPSYTYQWSPAGSIVSGDGTGNPTVAPAMTTTYSVTITNGPCETIETVTINVTTDLPLDIAGDINLCTGESTSLFANTQGAVFWFDDMGNQIGAGAQLDVTPAVTTTYTATATDGNCTNTQTVTVTVANTPIITISDDQDICAGESATISATTSLGALTWEPANEFADPTQGTQTVSPDGTTTYTAVADNNGCVVQDEVTINVTQNPIFSVADDRTICLGESVIIGGVEDPGTTYSWTASPADPSLTTPNSGTPEVSPTQTTTYTLTATNGACTVTETVTLDVTAVTLTANDVTTCAWEDVVLTASADSPGGAFSWTDWQGNELGTGESITVNPGETTSYLVSYDLNGCYYSQLVTVNVPESFNLGIDVLPATEVASGTEVTLTATGTENAPAGTTYAWTDEFGNAIGTGDTATHTPNQTTTYVLTATTPDGCTVVVRVVVVVSFQETRIPNVFTPSGDDLNDTFYPVIGLNVTVVEFRVFDRWGELVHDNPGTAWDGTLNGKKLPSDVYVYTARIIDANGEETTYKGSVTLLR